MRNSLAIAGRELRSYFVTPLAYVVLAVFSLITGYFFLQIVRFFQLQSMQYIQFKAPQMLERMNVTDMVLRPLFLNILVFFLFMVPFMTMRLIAEERKQGTFELLMTTPVRPWEIVAGKYLAGLGELAALIGVTFFFPAILMVVSDIEWQTVVLSYVGMFLLGAALVSLGLFFSALTDSQMVAAVMTFGVFLLLWVIGWAADGASDRWKPILEQISVLEHVEPFTKGILRVRDLAYYMSVIFLGVFLTHRVVEAQRWR